MAFDERQILPRQRQQREAAEDAAVQAAREATNKIDWDRDDGFWRDLDGSVIPFAELEDRRLWQLIIWLVENAGRACTAWASPLERAFGPAKWLASRPIFKALVVEAATRGLTFPPTTFNFIRDHLSDLPKQQSRAADAEPWRNEQLRQAQKATMDQIAGIIPEPYEKERRNIDLG